MNVQDIAAEKGALFLDEVLPGWVDHINVEAVDIKLKSRCILGQLAGGYYTGLRRLRIKDEYGYGFSLPAPPPDSTWTRLQEAWISEIEKRRSVNV